MQKFKIAIICPLIENVPPLKYGGTERIVYELTEGLIDKGHQVTLFAAGTSKTRAKLVATCPKPLSIDNNINPEAALIVQAKTVVDMQNKFDIIHSHHGWRFLPYISLIKIPVVNTHHTFFYDRSKFVFSLYKNAFYTSLSENQQKAAPRGMKFFRVVYNGININDFSLNLKPQSYSIFLGRFSPDKGPREAIKIALKLNIKLKIAAKIEYKNERNYQYYTDQIMPLLKNRNIEYVGEVGGELKDLFINQAKVLINPINWEEPFGLVVPEANAGGTPVVAYARGAMPELIKDGYNGFLVKPGNIDGMVKAVQRIYDMPDEEYQKIRQNCRKHVEENFTVEKMVDGYENVYQKIISKWSKK